MQALLLSDDHALAQELVSAAEQHGCSLSVEATGAVYEPGTSVKADVVLYDLAQGLPLQWKSLADWIRSMRAPLIVIGPDTHCTSDAVCVLRMGADDYVIRPFYMNELVARMEALLRRVEMSEATEIEHWREPGGLMIHPRSNRVELGGKVVSLTPTEFRVLSLLVSQAGNTVPREELISGVRGEDAPISEASLNLYVWNLRQKLENDPSHPRLIITRWGVGYSFLGPPTDS